MPLVGANQAIKAVVDYVNDFPNLIPTGDMRLEEIEVDEKQDEWVVTMSFVDNFITGSRSYKTFRVGGIAGDVKSMRIRNPLARN
jgi:hypothetical protein